MRIVPAFKILGASNILFGVGFVDGGLVYNILLYTLILKGALILDSTGAFLDFIGYLLSSEQLFVVGLYYVLDVGGAAVGHF